MATTFHFKSARWSAREKRASFVYQIVWEEKTRKPLTFKETLEFPKNSQELNPKTMKRWLHQLHLVLGLSYYKTFAPQNIALSPNRPPLSFKEAEFWNTLYTKGLGEFFFRNGVSLKTKIAFPYDPHQNAPAPLPKPSAQAGTDAYPAALLGIGGGKDSIVAGELLKQRGLKVTAFVLETGEDSAIVREVIQAMQVPSVVVRRHLDAKILKPIPGARNGHIPISAIFAWVGAFTAVLTGNRYMIVGNEASSNEGNHEVDGEVVNHQWSKTAEFEALLQHYLRHHVQEGVQYFSALRHFYELKIVEAFTKFPDYFKVFSSCNRSFRVQRERPVGKWCGECPKCAFVYAELAAFLPPKTVQDIFKKDLFSDSRAEAWFADLTGHGATKPWDCVGTFEESALALRMAIANGHALPRSVEQYAASPKMESALRAKLLSPQAAPTLPAPYVFLGLEKVLILGKGKEAQSLEKYLKKFYPKLQVELADEAEDPRAFERQVEFDWVLRSPGVPLAKLKKPWTTATAIFFEQRNSFKIGITGSKGKSTTTALIGALLHAAGISCTVQGNIGKPMLDSLLDGPPPHGTKKTLEPSSQNVDVLELSSYQLEDLGTSPNVAVVTNLFPEHMNHHGGLEPYYEAKKNITRHQTARDALIVPQRHALLNEWTQTSSADVLHGAAWTPSKTPLLGEHNQSNTALAITAAQTVCRALGRPKLSRVVIQKTVAQFKALPHRLQKLGTFDGRLCFDDAISTSPESTIEALHALSPLAPIGAILLGGEDRGYDFSSLEKALRQHGVKNLVLFPETGKRMIQNRDGFKILETTQMQEAVNFAFEVAPKGSIILLSTASPSYSLWKNFEAKGAAFEQAIHQRVAQSKME